MNGKSEDMTRLNQPKLLAETTKISTLNQPRFLKLRKVSALQDCAKL